MRHEEGSFGSPFFVCGAGNGWVIAHSVRHLTVEPARRRYHEAV